MADFDLTQTGQQVQDILDGAAMQSDLTAETERAEAAEQSLQGNIDAEKLRAEDAEQANASNIVSISSKIPAAASGSNQLADKAFVNSSIATATATYRGSYNEVADLSLSVDATHTQIAAALAGVIIEADNNDYCFVQVPTSDATPLQIASIERYKFDGAAWTYEYTLNNSGFTADQWAALNSGITSGLVAKLLSLPTNDELIQALATKQNVLVFDNVPTDGSTNPVKSGGIYTAINNEAAARAAAIAAIVALIPEAASALNQLADKAFVTSSISTATAVFKGTFNEVADLNLTVDATQAQIAAALAGAIIQADNNDYCFVQIPTSDATPLQIARTDRYKFNGTAWAYEYTLNNSGFTAAQWAAINSGITSLLKDKLIDLPTATELTAQLAAKQNTLTFDATPTAGSTNPVTSQGIKSAVDAEKLRAEGAEQANASNIVTINSKIPAAASGSNQLADKAFVNSSIATATATYRGSYNEVADLSLSVDATHTQIAAALAGVIIEADNNDYCFVQVPTSDATPLQIASIERYKFDGSSWTYEYTLNNSGFTADQWAALNSGITSGLVAKLLSLPTNDELTQELAAKQNVLTFDSTPTTGSNNPVTSNGIKAAIDTEAARAAAVEQGLKEDYDDLYQLYQTLSGGSIIPVAATDWPVSPLQQNVIYRVANSATPTAYSDYMYNGTTTILLATFTFPGIDATPTAGSPNLVTSGGVFANIGAFDISDYNKSGSTLATYADLTTALAALPLECQKGGMSVKFVQSSDNKYVQYRYMSSSTAAADFTNIANWQGVDNVPTNDSENLVKSGGVAKELGMPIYQTSWTNRTYRYDILPTPILSGEKYLMVVNSVTEGNTVQVALTNNAQNYQYFNVYVNEGENYKWFVADGDKNGITVSLSEGAGDISYTIYYDGIIPNMKTLNDDVTKLKSFDTDVAERIFDLKPTFILDNISCMIKSGTKSVDLGFQSSNIDRFASLLVKGTDVTVKFRRNITTAYVVVSQYSLNNDVPQVVFIPAFCDKVELSVPTNVASDLYLNVTLSDTDVTTQVSTIKGKDGTWKDSVNNNIKNLQYNNNICLDLGAVENATSADGTYTLSNTNTIVSTLVPIYTGKGKVLSFELPPNIKVAYNFYSSITAGAARDNYGANLVDGNKLITTHDYIFLMFSHTDNSVILPYEITDLESGVKVHITNVTPRIDYIHNTTYREYEKIDLTKLLVQRGSLNNNNGQFLFHVTRLFSDFIPVKPGSRLTLKSKVVENSFIQVFAFFYKIDESGNYTWLSNCQFKANTYNTWEKYAMTQPTSIDSVDVQVPTECNSVRFYFSHKDDNVLSASDINDDNIEIWCHTKDGFCEIKDNIIDFSNEPSINLLSAEWIQGGLNYSEGYSKYCMTASVFKVKEGQRLLIKHSNENKNYYVTVYGYNSINTSQEATNTFDIADTSAIYTVPSGVNYIRLAGRVASGYNPTKCVEDDWYIFDVTGDTLRLQHAEVYIEATHSGSYAQGMAIQNGYLFQGFADGTIDIYELSTKEKLQTLTVPAASDTQAPAMHCNNLTFGNKYNSGDTFGVLWVNNEEANTKMVGIRISLIDGTFSFEKVYEVLPPAIDTTSYQADDQYIDFSQKRLVQLCYTKDNAITQPSGGYGDLHISIYSWSGDFQESNFTLKDSFTFPILVMVQGGRLIDNTLYIASGAQINSITAFNILSCKPVGIVDLTRKCFNVDNELQGFDWCELGMFATSTKTDGNWKLYKVYL